MHYERFAVFNFGDRRLFPSEGRKKKKLRVYLHKVHAYHSRCIWSTWVTVELVTPVGTIGNGKSSNCGSAERQVRKTGALFSKSHQNFKVSIGKKKSCCSCFLSQSWCASVPSLLNSKSTRDFSQVSNAVPLNGSMYITAGGATQLPSNTTMNYFKHCTVCVNKCWEMLFITSTVSLGVCINLYLKKRLKKKHFRIYLNIFVTQSKIS